MYFEEYSTPAMIPIVFCASLAPCIRLKAAADTSCSRRNHWSTRPGRTLRSIQNVAVITSRPTRRPITGATTMKMIVLVQPAGMIALNPAFATAAPAYPPKSACDELVGNPKNHVIRFQVIAPQRPAKMTASVTYSQAHHPAADGLGNRRTEGERCNEVEERRPDHGLARREHAGRDDGSDRVRGVVEAVDVIEDERERDQGQNDGQPDGGIHERASRA